MSDTQTSQDAGAEVAHLLDLAVERLGGARRAGQHEMAGAVTGAMDSGEHLLVQAGTGTGKSLGYLVPAVHHAVHSGERVIVSTATLALQRQIMTRDLPLVADTLAPHLPRPPQLALLKGWHNYACLHKIAGGYPPDDPGTLFDLPRSEGPTEPLSGSSEDDAEVPSGLGQQILRVREWAAATESGDRDDLVPGVPDRVWRQVSVTALECLGQKCPLIEECYPERARGRAREADVVVTNHAMLGIAATGSPNVLPEHSVIVADEAHELPDRVTSAATAELSVASIEHAARQARRHGGIMTTDLDAAAADFGSVLAGLPAERFPDGLPDGARLAVGAVRDAARGLLSALKPDTTNGPGADGNVASSGLKMASSSMLMVFEIAERMAGEANGFDVLWCSRGGDGGFGSGMSKLHAAPLGVAGLMRTNLWDEKVGILTSATLALGDSFEPIARAVGLEKAASEPASVGTGTDAAGTPAPVTPSASRWRGLDVGSPFDYPRQGILYIARSLPTPGSQATTDAQADEMAALMEAAGGRTLGLFSSRRAAERAAELLRPRLAFPILCQGDDQLPALVRAFADDEPTCLFGTLSLWQGVDVPGPACSLVMIDRIPFPRPDDPVKAARARFIESHGGNGFMQVSATHAALLLAQGAGRLVRTMSDRGVVAVLDPRLATARYGSFLVQSLPDFWRTTDTNVALSALRRLADLG